MSQAAGHRSARKCLFAAVLLTLLAAVPQAPAAEDIAGEWGVTVDTEWGPMPGTLTFEKKADGTLTGKWGARALSNVKFENDQLTFTRIIPTPDGDITQDFKATVKDGKLIGVVSGDQGKSKVAGARRKPMLPVSGVWDLKYTVGDRDVAAKLTISQKPDGTPDAKWTTEISESVISNVKVQDDKVSFDRTIKFNDQEFEMTFEGTAQGDKLTGVSKSDMGDIPVTGTRVGADLIGKWEITAVSDMGTFTSLMVVHPDLTGTYEIFSDVPMKDIRFENGQLMFTVQFGPEDQPFKMDFKGKVEGKTLKGQMTSDMGTSEVTGKKMEPAAAPAAASSVVGTWEFTREGRDGTQRTSTLTIKPDMTGAYRMRDTDVPVTNLTVNGDQVSFKVTTTYNENEVVMEFKGKVEGKTLTGEFTTSRGTREAVGKKVQ
jgi:hypothetical protein